MIVDDLSRLQTRWHVAPSSSHEASRRLAPGFTLYVIVFLLVAIPYACRFWLLQTRLFDQDEFEHLHGAWLVSKGFLPYRDYFEHHTPLFHFLLAPVFWRFDVQSNVADAFAAITAARGLMWILTGIILILTFTLGTSWRDTRIGIISTLLLTNTEIFFKTTLEVRPDLLGLTCFLAGLVAILYAVRAATAGTADRRLHFAASGAFLGAGIMATQKALFTLPGFGLAMLLFIWNGRSSTARAHRLRYCVYQAAGFCAPILVVLIYFYLHDGLAEFMHYNVLFNFRFKQRFGPYEGLHQLFFDNPYLALMAMLGLARLVAQTIRERNDRDVIVAPSTLGVIAGLFLIPVPYAQYYLLLLPLAAMSAAAFLIDAVEFMIGLRQRGPGRDWWRSAGLRSLVVLIFLSMTAVGAGSNHPVAVTIYWYAVLLVALVVLWMRYPRTSLAFFLIAVSLPPLKRLHDGFDSRNTSQLAAIRYVIETTSPTDTVMDGFSGYGVFRPHAYFYFFPHYGIRTMLTDDDRRQLLERLQSGRIAPTLIVMDSNLRGLSPEITALFERRYRPTGVDDIWRRKDAVERQVSGLR